MGRKKLVTASVMATIQTVFNIGMASAALYAANPVLITVVGEESIQGALLLFLLILLFLFPSGELPALPRWKINLYLVPFWCSGVLVDIVLGVLLVVNQPRDWLHREEPGHGYVFVLFFSFLLRITYRTGFLCWSVARSR